MDTVLRVTLLLSASGLGALLLRRARAEARHRVWVVGIAMSLIIIPAARFAPTLFWLPSAAAGPVDLGAVGGSAVGVTSIAVPWILWVVGVALSACWVVFGSWAAHRMVVSSSVVDSSGAAVLLADAKQQLGVRRRVALVTSASTDVPVVWGVRRPHIVLPLSWVDWSRDLLRSVLLHELAHVRRLDLVTRWIGAVARSIFWFHPLMWLADHRMRVESERASDELAAGAGGNAAMYAQHLIELARRARSPVVPLAATAMARRNGLEARIASLLDDGARFCGPGKKLVIVAAFISASCMAVTSFGPEAPNEETARATAVLFEYRGEVGGRIQAVPAQPSAGEAGGSYFRATPDRSSSGQLTDVVATGRVTRRTDTSLVFVAEQRPRPTLGRVGNR